MPTKGTVVTDKDLQLAHDMGEMKADIRTVKHDIANVQQGITGINARLNTITAQQQRGLGFFAGAAFILAGAGGVLLAAFKVLFGGTA